MKRIFFFLFISISVVSFGQQKKKIKVINADITYTDPDNPEAMISIGNVYAEIDGATIRCQQVELYSKQNYMKALGDVVMNQGDTVIQTSKFADYDGNENLARSWGGVVLKDPSMTLTTEKLFFDRENQHLYYNQKGTIKDSVNVLVSSTGNYFLTTKKFQAKVDVVVTNPDHVIESNHLDYYTDSGRAFLYGPSTITSAESLVYTEKGFSDTKNKISHLTKNSWIQYEDRLIEGDSLFHNGATNFSSASGNIKLTDTINDSTLKGGYAEVFKDKDSAFVVDKAVAISLIEKKDSMYIHGDTLLITGKPTDRVIRAYHHVKFYKIDLRGKCDSLVSVEKTGLTKMFRKPVLWSEGNQITGDVIHFLSDTITQKLDSLKVLKNAFLIQKDSAGYNQTKGRDLFGKFLENDLRIVDVVGNGEVLHYVRNEEQDLIGITKIYCSNILVELENSAIKTISFLVNPEGKTYPEEEIHVNDREIKGFVWREDEKPIDKDDIFRHDPKDEDIMKQERIKEREARIQAIKDAEEKRLREIAAKELQRVQDSISAANPPPVLSDKEKQDINEKKKAAKEARKDAKKKE
ncbi:MAG: OstA-like protein [Urechidicola sp.]|nr:OstA-like protein [Urechidicola sp.]